MSTHLSLIIALALIFLVEYLSTRNAYHRNWCGFRLAFPILFQAFIPMTLVLVIYVEFFHVISTLTNGRYFILISFVIATLAHLGWKSLLRFLLKAHGSETESPLITFSVIDARIAAKKLIIMRELMNSTDCKKLLGRAINLSSASHQRRKQLKEQLDSTTSDEGEILSLIDAIGVTTMKVVLKGDSHV